MVTETNHLFSFHYNLQLAQELRNTVNDFLKPIYEKEGKIGNKPYRVWDRLTAGLDRIEGIIDYLNTIVIGNCTSQFYAFDFFEYLNNASTLIDCIRILGCMFNDDFGSNIKHSQDCFEMQNNIEGTDGEFFEYIRSVCVVHPIGTTRHPTYRGESPIHCCSLVAWCHASMWAHSNSADLIAQLYTSTNNNNHLQIEIRLVEFDKYIEKWVNSIIVIIDKIKKYASEFENKYRHALIKNESEFTSYIDYIRYLKSESNRRLGEYDDSNFNDTEIFISTPISYKDNIEKINKYINALKYSITFKKNSLQNMSEEGYDNTGLNYVKLHYESSLFNELHFFYCTEDDFSKYNYGLRKLYKLTSSEHYYSYWDKQFARDLLNPAKDLINRYVTFTNAEPDYEVALLVSTAHYLHLLEKPSIINANIPNSLEYRISLLDEKQIDELHRHFSNNSICNSNNYTDNFNNDRKEAENLIVKLGYKTYDTDEIEEFLRLTDDK